MTTTYPTIDQQVREGKLTRQETYNLLKQNVYTKIEEGAPSFYIPAEIKDNGDTAWGEFIGYITFRKSTQKTHLGVTGAWLDEGESEPLGVSMTPQDYATLSEAVETDNNEAAQAILDKYLTPDVMNTARNLILCGEVSFMFAQNKNKQATQKRLRAGHPTP